MENNKKLKSILKKGGVVYDTERGIINKNMKTEKYIKTKDKITLLLNLQKLILAETNAGLISLDLNIFCRKFIDELLKIPLSEELQSIIK